MARPVSYVAFLFLSLLTLLILPVNGGNGKYVETYNSDGVKIMVPDDRRPSLYTQNFGDCMGGSLINVSRFDAAWYRDNMTIMFHLEGSTNVANDSIMSKEMKSIFFAGLADLVLVYIGVFAYGTQRFDLTFDPCKAQIYRYEYRSSDVETTC